MHLIDAPLAQLDRASVYGTKSPTPSVIRCGGTAPSNQIARKLHLRH